MVSIGQAWGVRASSRDGSEWVPPAPDPQTADFSELRLLEAGRSGDRAALEALIGRHKGPLYALCFGMLGHADDAEDAVQETFLHALRALPAFRGDAAFRTWLHRIALNLCLRWRARRRPTTSWDDEQAVSLAPAASPETIALRHLRIGEALATLRPRQRAVLLLKELEGWSMAEIGASLGWNEKRVENELYRARRALATWRQQETDEGESR
jgi:RNA polymerase sigma-70 factor, ECF subfamily